MWAEGATVDFVTGHYVQRKRLVYHRLFEQDETAVRRVHGLRGRPEERDRHSGASDTLQLLHICPLDGDAFLLTVKHSLFVRDILKLKLTGLVYRLTVAFFFTGVLADGFAIDLAGTFDGAKALPPLPCDASSRRCRLVIISVFSRLTRLSSST